MGKDLNGNELGKGIRQRANGTYMARYIDKYKVRHTISNKNLKVLKKQLEKARYEVEYSMLSGVPKITLEEWFEQFLQLYKVGKVKETTLYRIRQTFSPCKRNNLGSMYLSDIRAMHIQELINKLDAQGFAYSTLDLLKALLKELFKRAIGNGFVAINPCDAVVLPKREIFEARYLTEQEQKAFLDMAKGYYHYDIFCFALSCGARIGEVLGLKWSDIDFDNRTIQIARTLHYAKVNDEEPCHFFFTTPKTKTSERKIPMLPETEEILRRVHKSQLLNRILYAKKWKQEDPFEDMVFTTMQGAPIRYGDVNRSIKTIIAKINMQEEELAKLENREPVEMMPFSPHCFRHTFITRCKMNGVPYETIQPYVGHSTKEMTEYYNHYKEEIDVGVLKSVNFGVVQ